jgi:hypothetical protein
MVVHRRLPLPVVDAEGAVASVVVVEYNVVVPVLASVVVASEVVASVVLASAVEVEDFVYAEKPVDLVDAEEARDCRAAAPDLASAYVVAYVGPSAVEVDRSVHAEKLVDLVDAEGVVGG